MIQAVVVVGLASFYITYTVKYLEGPFGVYHKILSLAGVILPVYGDDGEVIRYVDADVEIASRFITKVVHCFWCLTTWVCLAITITYGVVMGTSIAQLFLIWLAASGLSSWLFERISDGTSE